MRDRRAAVAAALTALLAGVLALAGSAAADRAATTARLTLDGVAFAPELALTEAGREKGLMNRDPAPKDGMLFVFPRPTTAAFWMKDTEVPLAIRFFDAAGRRVAGFRMTPCSDDPCRTYSPKRLYRFALELPVSDRRPAKRLGPVSELRRLVQRSS
jgi:uncharacterized membrane protein (UPF0127 family)